jgi:hypothetical protein
MKTVSLQIGNGDDRLSQREWHDFVIAAKELVADYCAKLHFFGAPENWCAQQNVAFIFDAQDERLDELKARVTALRKQFRQESAAWTVGETTFL